MTDAPRYSRSPDLGVIRSETGTLYIMSLPDGLPQAMNESAQAVWEVAVSGSGRILEEVAEIFDVSPEAIARDVEVTMQSFLDLGFIQPDGGSEA